MNRVIAVFAFVLAIFPALAQEIRVDFDHACDFSRFTTYSWAPPIDAGALNQLMQQRIMGFVEEALAARRLKRVEKGGDLLVSFQMMMREQEQYTTFTSGPGFGWDWGWGTAVSTTTSEPILTGTLVLDISDARRNHLIFQGTSTTTMSSRPERNTKKLAKGVNKIFAKYPPR